MKKCKGPYNNGCPDNGEYPNCIYAVVYHAYVNGKHTNHSYRHLHPGKECVKEKA